MKRNVTRVHNRKNSNNLSILSLIPSRQFFLLFVNSLLRAVASDSFRAQRGEAEPQYFQILQRRAPTPVCRPESAPNSAGARHSCAIRTRRIVGYKRTKG